MNKRNLTPAPIDNKNILEDFADTIVCEFDEGIAERQTFWRDRCLYLVDYAFGTNSGTVRCVYGNPTDLDILKLKDELFRYLNCEEERNTSCCELEVSEKDIRFAFYWREE